MSEKIKINVRSLGLIGLLGGLGGAINAWLCYANIPVPMGEPGHPPDFPWYIVLLGAVHGGLLASVSISMTTWLFKRHWLLRIAGFPLTGWLAGWISFIPVDVSFGMSLSGSPVLSYLSTGGGWNALAWPFQTWRGDQGLWWRVLEEPYGWFGLVGSLYYLFLNLCRQLSQKSLPVHLLIGSLSGSLGSLLLWVEREPWYFSFLHGTIWGSLVGYGVWKARQGVEKVHHL